MRDELRFCDLPGVWEFFRRYILIGFNKSLTNTVTELSQVTELSDIEGSQAIRLSSVHQEFGVEVIDRSDHLPRGVEDFEVFERDGDGCGVHGWYWLCG